MAETKKIIHIETTSLGNLDSQQLGVLANNDPDLGYRAWGGKDSLGGITIWLAKDKNARISNLTISSISGNSGILQHNSSGVITGEASINALSDVVVSSPLDGQVLVYDDGSSNWINSNVTLDPTLDDCYNNDTGERTVIVDDGNISFDLDAATSQIIIDLTANADDTAGFYVTNSAGEYFRIRLLNDEGQYSLEVQSSSGGGSGKINYDLGCNSFQVAASGAISALSSAGAVSIGSQYAPAGGDLYFYGHNNFLPYNDLSNLTLSGSFSATSIVGALNEVKAGFGSLTLDDCYNNDTGERTITVDNGDVSFDLDAATSKFSIDLTANADDPAGFYITNNAGEYFRIRLFNDEGQYSIEVQSSSGGGSGRLNYDLGCRGFSVTATNNINLLSTGGFCAVGSQDASSGALYFYGYNNFLPYNDLSNLTLSGYSATSVIGALNEIKTAHSLDAAYNADTGERTVTVDAGTVNFVLSNSYGVQIYQNPGAGTTNTLLTVHADGGNWNASSKGIYIISDDLLCLPLVISDGSSDKAYFQNTGELNCFGVTVGSAGVIKSGTGYFVLGSTTSAPRLTQMTTTQRDALTPSNGMMIYNTTTNKFQGRENGAWVNFV